MECEQKTTGGEIDVPPRLKILTTLIEIGDEAKPADIVRITGLERHVVQYALGQLLEGGLILCRRGGRYTPQKIFLQPNTNSVKNLKDIVSDVDKNSTLCQALSTNGGFGGQSQCDTCDRGRRLVVLRNILHNYIDTCLFSGDGIDWEEID